MNRKQIIASVSLIALVGAVIYLRNRRRTHLINQLKADQVAAHGYETAHDILFPKKKRVKKF